MRYIWNIIQLSIIAVAGAFALGQLASISVLGYKFSRRLMGAKEVCLP